MPLEQLASNRDGAAMTAGRMGRGDTTGRRDDGDPDTSIPSWSHRRDATPWYDTFPWWAVVIALILGWMAWLIITDEGYNSAWHRTIPGLWLTIRATLWSFFLACGVGLILALFRTSRSVILRNIARTYVEFIRGIPILVLIFTIALVIVPEVSDALGWDNRISAEWRAIIALVIIYAGYIAEIFRAGIQSIDRGQIEAGRSLGLSRRQTTGSIILPQAVRAVVPPLGNDFIAILKDTSLLSVLGVLDVTLRARQYAASTFKFRDSYFVLCFIYLTLTVLLSLLLQVVEKRLNRGRQEAA
ncbi:MAG: amino acid ABC transporter permease [Acidimicrobiales bacterium]